MANNAAQAAKQKGNDAFGRGDFPAAIGHYTSAIIADAHDPIYPLNRAAAYLKLGKYQDAERDCSTAIRLDSKNQKAWYRRAQARQGLDVWDDALSDYKQAFILDPKKVEIKQDIARVEFLIKNGKKQTRRAPADVLAPPTQPASPDKPDKPRRRRVPITIVDDPEPLASSSNMTETATSTKDLLTPISTRRLTPSTEPPTNTPKPLPSKSSSTPAPTSRPGGGIFRKNGNHRVFGSEAQSIGANSGSTPTGSGNVPPPPLNVDILPKDFAELSMKTAKTVPTSLYAFDRNWMALKTPQAKWSYMKQITPESLPSVFKTSLDTTILSSIIRTFHVLLNSGVDSSAVKEYMVNFPRVARWATLTMLLSKEESVMIKEIWEALPSGPDDAQLRKAWGIR